MHDSCVVLLGLAGMDVDGSRVPGVTPALFVVGSAAVEGSTHRHTIDGLVLMLRRFQRFTADWPWNRRPVDSTSSLPSCAASRRRRRRSGPTRAARQFLDFVSDPRNQWLAVCERISAPNRPDASGGSPSRKRILGRPFVRDSQFSWSVTTPDASHVASVMGSRGGCTLGCCADVGVGGRRLRIGSFVQAVGP